VKEPAAVSGLQVGASDLGEVLRLRSEAHGDRLACAFLRDGVDIADSWTYGELDARARAIAARLQGQFAPGDRLVLLYPPGLDFVAAFFGCLYAGMIAVPAYPPRRGKEDVRIVALAHDCRPAGFLSVAAGVEDLEVLQTALGAGEGGVVATDVIGADHAGDFNLRAIDPGAVAFLQYTSGSTAAPKGVMVTHANMMANEFAIQAVMEHDESLVALGWLPVFHDMGLLGNLLQPLFVGGSSILIPPLTFLKRPLCWLEAVSKYGATSSGGPNFAFDLCARLAEAQGVPKGLDLSSWTVAYVGAEPVRPDTLRRFAAAFKGAGFRSEAYFPCYGMAESTLIATGGPKARPPVLPRISTRALLEGRGETRRLPGPGSRRITGCGHAVPQHTVLVVDPETREPSADGSVGEIWISGPSVAIGYYRNPEATEEIFAVRTTDGRGPFLRTGDLGFARDGEFFITGRLKDMLVIRGQNHYPSDIELTVEGAHPGLQPNASAAFSTEVDGAERLVVAVEISRMLYQQLARGGDGSGELPLDELVVAVREKVMEIHEIPVHQLAILKPGGVPRTSSGKIRRAECRRLHGERKLTALAVA